MSKSLMNYLIALLTCLFVSCACTRQVDSAAPARQPQTDDVYPLILPNSCFVIATQAFEALRGSGCWCRILLFQFKTPEEIGGHALVVWQPVPNGHVVAFDLTFIDGTMPLETRNRDIVSVARALADTPQFRANSISILTASFYE